MRSRSHLPAATAAAVLLSACTITRVGGEDSPPRIESDGLIEGHAAVGMRDEDEFVRLRVLDGESDGSLGEIVVWKLLRLEIGALGVGVGVGPFDLALGTLFYEPRVPPMGGATEAAARAYVPDDGCEICAAAAAAEKAAAESAAAEPAAIEPKP